MKMEKSLVNKISESGYKMDTLEILDHVIAIQLDKIEYIHSEHTSPVGESSEKAMENMIKLLEIRAHRKK